MDLGLKPNDSYLLNPQCLIPLWICLRRSLWAWAVLEAVSQAATKQSLYRVTSSHPSAKHKVSVVLCVISNTT